MVMEQNIPQADFGQMWAFVLTSGLNLCLLVEEVSNELYDFIFEMRLYIGVVFKTGKDVLTFLKDIFSMVWNLSLYFYHLTLPRSETAFI